MSNSTDYLTYDYDDVYSVHQRAEHFCHEGTYRTGDCDMMNYDDFGYLDYIELMS